MKDNIKNLLSDIKTEEDLDKTATFTDIISRKEYKKRKKEQLYSVEEIEVPSTLSPKIKEESIVNEEENEIKEKKSPILEILMLIILLLVSGCAFYFKKDVLTVEILFHLSAITLAGILICISLFQKEKKALPIFSLLCMIVYFISYLIF